MANFNPDLNPTADPDYEKSVGNVGLINAEASNRNADSAKWDAFFKTASKGIGLLDKAVASGAKEEVEAGYQGLNQKYGLDAESTLAGEAPTSPYISRDQPPRDEQNRIASDIKRAQAAYDQGKFSYSRYYAELENVMKGVKSRYPGYSDIIDKQVESITGVTPANALAKARMHEFNQLQAQATEKLDVKEKFILNNADELSQAQREELRSGKLSVDDAISKIQDRQGEVKEIQRTVSTLNMLKSKNELDEKTAEKGAGEVTFGIHRMAMEDVSTLATKAKEELDKGTYDPAKYGLLLEQTKLTFQQKAMQAVESGVGNSLSFEKKQKLINDAVSNFDNIAKVFTSKDSGMLDYLHSDIEAMKNKDLRATLNDPSAGVPLRAILAAQAAGGPQVAGLLLSTMDDINAISTNIQRAISKATPAQVKEPVSKNLTMNQVVSMGTANASLGSSNPLELVSNLKSLGKDSPFAVTRVLGMWRDSLTNPQYGESWQKNSAKVLFGPDNKEFLTKAFKDPYSRNIAYGILTSPEITVAMQKLKGTQEYENYKEWAYNGYVQVLKDSTHRLSAIVYRPYFDLKFNEENGHFDLVPSKLGIEASRKYGASNAVQASVLLDKLLGKGLSDDVRRLNSATDNISKIMEGDKYKTPEQIKNLVHSLSVSTSGEKKGLWTWMAGQMMSTQDIVDKDPDLFEFGGKHPNFTTASGTNGEPRGITSLIEEGNYGGALDALKSVISKGESGEDYNRLVNKKGSSEALRAPLTDMTVGEVLNYQRGMKSSGHLSSAAGKYQILKGTLQSLINEGVLTSEDKYDRATQEKAAEALLKRRGLDDYLKGRKPLRSFLRDLGDEWEIVKVNKKVAQRVISELETLRTNLD